jgi:tetratricopeptide (TPR) repeat protein
MNTYLFSILLALIPLLAVPITQDYYVFNKWTVLILCSLITVIIWFITSIRKSTYIINWSQPVLGLGAIALVSCISLFTVSVNRVEALLDPFGPVTFLVFTVIVILLPTLILIPARKTLLWFLYGSTALLALISIYQFFGMGKIMFPGVSYLSDPLWTPTGSSVASLTIFILIVPLIISHAWQSWKAKNDTQTGILTLGAFVIIAATVITAILLIPTLSSAFLPIREGWMIMLEILKNPKQALFGVGAENFLAAFTAGRPLLMNTTPAWSMRFTTNATFFFHIITIYGLLGALACIFFAKSLLPRPKNTFSISLLLAIISIFLVPPNICILAVIITLLVLSQNPKQVKELHFKAKRWLKITVSTILGISIIGALVLLVLVYGSELAFYQSILKAKENNGTATYNLQIQAIQRNPKVSRFHIAFSQTNLGLATSLASTIKETNQLSDQAKANQTKDRQLVAQLIEQAIREAKLAVNLNIYNIVAWENLANTYQQIIGVAQGADEWAIASYQEAIRRDPTNPILSLDLGSVYIRLNKYPEAITQFQQAIAKKSDFANAYYNLSNAYKLNKDSVQAISALEKAATLVNKTSQDYSIITRELESLQKNSSVTSTPAPSPFIAPPLSLPSSTGPNTSR